MDENPDLKETKDDLASLDWYAAKPIEILDGVDDIEAFAFPLSELNRTCNRDPEVNDF